MNPSTVLARALVRELIACGVRDVVLCPGSRNAPLSLAVHAAAAAGRVRLHVRIDERSAGFVALGLGRGAGSPAAVITTSGTAVANLHPAVLEAHHGGVPLLVFSADRPPRLRGVGANQVIDQRSVFGGGVLRFWGECGGDGPNLADDAGRTVREAITAAGGTARPGPAQVNVAFDTPLLADDLTEYDDLAKYHDPAEYDAVPRAATAVPAAPEPGAAPTGVAPTGVATARADVVPGPQPGEECVFIVDLANTAGVDLGPLAARHPVVSEAGGLAGADVLAGGMWLLGDGAWMAAHRPERVIVLGRVTLFRQVTALVSDPHMIIDMVCGPAGVADVAGRARIVAPALGQSDATAPGAWLTAWRRADAAARAVVNRGEIDPAAIGPTTRDSAAIDPAAIDTIGTSPELARTLGAALPDSATLVLGSSQPPRDVALFTAARGGIRVVANRGVAGIDGTISTAAGVALAGPGSGPTVALMGDLTFVHDLTGLAIGPNEPRPALTIVVANNDGGAIFATLEQGEPRYRDPFERVFAAPLEVDLASIVAGLGATHRVIRSAAELDRALREPGDGIRVLEVPVSRANLRAHLAGMAAAVSAALADMEPVSPLARPGSPSS